MGYREFGSIGFEARMESFMRLWRTWIMSMLVRPFCMNCCWMKFIWPCIIFYVSYVFC